MRPSLAIRFAVLALALSVRPLPVAAQPPQCTGTSATVAEDLTLIATLTCAEGGLLRGLEPDHVRTVAGSSGQSGSDGDGGAATAATLNLPHGIHVDAAGNLLIAESGGHVVRRVDGATALITTLAGFGLPGFAGDGGPATHALLNDPRAAITDARGNVFIADVANARIRRVDAATGIITTVVGGGSEGLAEGLTAIQATLIAIGGIAFDATGDLFFVEVGRNRIRRVSSGADGVITGAADEILRTVAGTGTQGFSGDGGPAAWAQFAPEDLAFGGTGHLYIADRQNHRIRRISPGADGLVRGASDEIVVTIAGGGDVDADGIAATLVTLTLPRGVDVDLFGNVFISEAGALRVRRVDGATGVISTVLGGNAVGEDIPTSGARTFNPRRLDTDIQGNLFVAELGAHRIRAVRLVPSVVRYELAAAPAHGVATVSPTGTLTYVPQKNYFGEDALAFRGLNGAGQSSEPASVQITVTPVDDPPVAKAGPDRVLQGVAVVTLDGSGSSDPDGTPLTFSWRLTTRPSGSLATLENAGTARPSFVPDAAGEYVVELTVADASGAAATDSASVVIVAPVPRLTIVASVAFAAEFAGEGSLTISRTGFVNQPLMVYFTRTGTASLADFQPLPASPVTIPAGAAAVVVRVVPVNDSLVEGPETVTLQLSSAAGYTLGTDVSATVTIVDNDVIPTVKMTAADSFAAEPANKASFTLSRSGEVASALAVTLTISGTANADDLNVPPLSAFFGQGQREVTIFVTPRDDAFDELTETLIVTIVDGTGYKADPANKSVEIVVEDNDGLAEVSVRATYPYVTEGTGDWARTSFEVRRTGSTDAPLLVMFSRTGSASNADLSGIPELGGVVIQPGQTTQTIDLIALDDQRTESRESVVLELLPGPYHLASPTWSQVFIEDPGRVTIRTSAPYAMEGTSIRGSFVIQRSGEAYFPYPLTIQFVNTGTASATDYRLIQGVLQIPSATSVTIPAGSNSITVEVLALRDELAEGQESVTLQLTPGPYKTEVGFDTATVTIF